MKLSYTPPSGSAANLDELGIVYILSQQSHFAPEELPQRESRTLAVKIQFWEDGYARNYNALNQVREALKKQNGVLKWTDEDQQSEEGQIIPGGVLLEQTVTVVSADLPEDPNAWGTFQQEIVIVFRYEVTDLAEGGTHLEINFTSDAPGGGTVTLGHVYGFKEDFKTQYYNDLKDNRSRSSGTVTAAGEFLSNAKDKPADRRAALITMKADMEAVIQGQSGTLQYGASGNYVFNRKVRVDQFVAEVDQANWAVKWSLAASYTIFPQEDGYAAADYRIGVSQDQESGDLTLTVAGKVAAATEVLANAKLDVVLAAALVNGWSEGHLIRKEQDQNLLFTDDGPAFIEISFNRSYRRRAADVLSYTLTIGDGEETRNGLIQRTYAGSVIACAATDSAAYQAAYAKALALGANQHPIQLASKVTRSDRQVSGGSREFVRLEFSFDYEVKSKRVWVEVNSEKTSEVFGENSEQVSGFIVAETLAGARELYATKIRGLYNGRHVRGERTAESKALTETGTVGINGFTGNGRLEEIPHKLDFTFQVWSPKPMGFFALKYGLEVELDYVALRSTSVLRGRVYADPAALESIRSAAQGNKLDTFLAGFNLGKLIGTHRVYECEQDGVGGDTIISVDFRNTYLNAVASPYLILASEVSEEIVYSGKRWVFQPVPDGAVVPQECGIEAGRRTVSGSVTAATEVEAMRFVKKMHSGPGSLWNTFPSGVAGGAKPATRYEDQVRINRSWETLPLTELTLASNPSTNRMANATFCKVSFTFAETLPQFASDSLDL